MRGVWGSCAILLGLHLAGCPRDTRRVDLEAAPDDLVVFAVTDTDEAVIEVRASRGRDAVALSFGEGHTLYTFAIDRREFVDADGEPLSDDALDRVRADLGATPGSCGRCLAPAVAGPKVVMLGESCPITPRSNAKVYTADGDGVRTVDDAEAIARVRGAVRLTWDGDCPCDRTTPELSRPAVVCPLAPVGAPIGADKVRLLEDGSVFGVNAGFAFRVNNAGEVRSTAFFPTGTVEAIGVLSDGQPIVGTTDPALLARSIILHRFDDELGRIELGAPPAFDASQIVSFEPGFLHFFGETFTSLGDSPGIVRCRVGAESVDCLEESLIHSAARCPNATAGKLVGGFSTPNGAQAAIGGKGHLWYRDPNRGVWYCDPDSDQRQIATPSGATIIHDVLAFGASGDRVLACVVLSSVGGGNEHGAVLTYRLPPLTFDPNGDPGPSGFEVSLVTDELGGDSFCQAVVSVPEAPGVLRAFERNGMAAIDVDATGTIVARHGKIGGVGADLWPEIPEPIIHVETSSSGYTLAAARSRRVYVRARGGLFEPRYTSVPLPVSSASALRVYDGAAWAFLGDGQDVLRVTRDSGRSGCDALVVEAVSFDEPLTVLGEPIELALPDRRHPDRVVLLTGAGASMFRIDVDLTTRTIVDRIVLGPGGAGFVDGAELTPGRYVIVRTDGSYWTLDDDGLQPLIPIRDDPTTIAVEPPVEPLVGELPITGIDVNNGVGWIGGFGTVGRVTAAGDDVTLETFWLERLSGGAYLDELRERPPNVTAVHAFCPDDVLLLAAERLSINEVSRARSRVRAWESAPGLDALEAYAGFAFTQAEAPSGGSRGRAIAADGGRTDLFFSDGVVFRNGTQRTVLPFDDVRAAVHVDGFTLVGGQDGRVAAVVEVP